MKLRVAALTDTGLVRTSNEDAFLVAEPLFAVADGMGGHQAGEVASGTTIATLKELADGIASDEDPSAALVESAKAANRAVYEKAAGDPSLLRMGTTLTAAVARDGQLSIAHVGDSRAYLFREGRLEQLTQDHTLVAEYVRHGRMSEEEAKVHPNRSIITRALGVEPDIVIDTVTLGIKEGDRVLLCSDGLYSMVSDEAIAEILEKVPDTAAATRELVDAANAAGGEDNTTVLIIDVVADGSDTDQAQDRSLKSAESQGDSVSQPDETPSAPKP
ncbi:MAG: Stp1/IreP family PP2C-type Ser/Thr phosphatase [Acidimicrobiia bacterium]